MQSCGNYRGRKVISHTMKLWEGMVEKRQRLEVNGSSNIIVSSEGRAMTDGILHFMWSLEKNREGQKGWIVF